RHGLPLDRCARIALAEKTALYQALVDCVRHGTRLADKAARPFGRAHDRATSTHDPDSEVANAPASAGGATAATAKCRRLSIAVVDDRFFFDRSRAEHRRGCDDAAAGKR